MTEHFKNAIKLNSKYRIHIVKFTQLEYTTQCILSYSQSSGPIATIYFWNIFTPQIKLIPISIHSPKSIQNQEIKNLLSVFCLYSFFYAKIESYNMSYFVAGFFP